MIKKFVRPKPVHKRQTEQKWLVGAQVRLTKIREPALRNVPARRLTATGVISCVFLKFSRTPNLRHVVYEIALDSEILGNEVLCVSPGEDSIRLELL